MEYLVCNVCNRDFNIITATYIALGDSNRFLSMFNVPASKNCLTVV